MHAAKIVQRDDGGKYEGAKMYKSVRVELQSH